MIDPIAIDGFSKRYGDFEAVSQLTLSVPEGSICGLLGPNGAGKTSTIKCLVGLARPTAGSIAILGGPPRSAMFERVAFIPERSALYDDLTGNDHFAMATYAYKSFEIARARKMLAIFDLDARKRVRKFSKGQKTAFALALAFAIRPSVMILDEPASGLDPINQRAVLDLLIEAAANGATILFSSHQIGQVERAADRVAILKRGKLIVDGIVDELKDNEKLIEATFDRKRDLNGLANDGRIRRIEWRGNTLRAFVHTEYDAVAQTINAHNPNAIAVLDLNLEEIFFNAVEEPRANTLEDV